DINVNKRIILAFQTLGVVFGDVGTSPLYTFSVMFRKTPINGNEDILRTLSLVLYTLILIPCMSWWFCGPMMMVKLLFAFLSVYQCSDSFVLVSQNHTCSKTTADGTFALYSLICCHVKVSLLPNQLPSDARISSFRLKVHPLSLKEDYILILVLVGTSLVIMNGVVSPAMS
ncbi:Potassium transporter 13, partial [Mucuna pruriens]